MLLSSGYLSVSNIEHDVKIAEYQGIVRQADSKYPVKTALEMLLFSVSDRSLSFSPRDVPAISFVRNARTAESLETEIVDMMTQFFSSGDAYVR